MTTLIPSFAAVIAALNISLGADVGGFFLETIAKELDAEIWGAKSCKGGGGGARGGSGGVRGGRGTGSNLLLLLAYLYNYGVAHCTLVYDIIGLLVNGAFVFVFPPCSMSLCVFSARCMPRYCVLLVRFGSC